MEIFSTKNLIIRNFVDDDLVIANEHHIFGDGILDDVKETIKNSFNDDLDSDGEKHFAVTLKGALIGQIGVDIRKLAITISKNIIDQYDTRIINQELLLTLVKYLHMIYPHREIICYLGRFDLKNRGVLEMLGFVRKNLDKEKGIYTYSLFKPNPRKDK
ncbi:MAG TPA: hypothetical protein DDW20_00140 [Firmicutes bacterium]|nr:hypothetical protein [Bacillota bacterium]